MASALDGITVLDLGTGPAAALATMFFADHGARVIRIVQPEDAEHAVHPACDQFQLVRGPIVSARRADWW